MTQRFDPVPGKVISQNIRTSGLDQMRNGFILRMVIAHRVRCIMDNLEFSGDLNSYIRKFINVPVSFNTSNQYAIDAYLDSEVLEITTAFKQYEENNKQYQEDIKAIAFYKGNNWKLVSTTFSGTMITIEV